MIIEEKLKDFGLISTSGQTVNTQDLESKPALLVVITCNHCPYAVAYWTRIIKLASNFQEDGLATIAICGNDASKYPADSYENMQKLATELNLPFPYLHDPKQEVINQLGAQRTPEVFLFDKNRELVYQGAIDDNWENEHAVMEAYLEEAIEYCLDNLEIDQPETQAVGCSVKWLTQNA
jgi:peroxiredoxin